MTGGVEGIVKLIERKVTGLGHGGIFLQLSMLKSGTVLSIKLFHGTLTAKGFGRELHAK
jgi:hypothetical protein